MSRRSSGPYRSSDEPEAELVFAVPLVRQLQLLRLLLGRDRPSELRLERVGGGHRLRVVGTALVVREPFVLSGASNIDEWRRIFMTLEVEGAGGARVRIAATAAESEPAPIRDDWFDGALMDLTFGLADLVVTTPRALVDLRDALLKI